MSYVEMALIAIGVATLSWLLCGVAVAVMARRRGGGGRAVDLARHPIGADWSLCDPQGNASSLRGVSDTGPARSAALSILWRKDSST